MYSPYRSFFVSDAKHKVIMMVRRFINPCDNHFVQVADELPSLEGSGLCVANNKQQKVPVAFVASVLISISVQFDLRMSEVPGVAVDTSANCMWKLVDD